MTALTDRQVCNMSDKERLDLCRQVKKMPVPKGKELEFISNYMPLARYYLQIEQERR